MKKVADGLSLIEGPCTHDAFKQIRGVMFFARASDAPRLLDRALEFAEAVIRFNVTSKFASLRVYFALSC